MGVPQDDVQAYRWTMLSYMAGKGKPASDDMETLHDLLETRMSTEQKRAAMREIMGAPDGKPQPQ